MDAKQVKAMLTHAGARDRNLYAYPVVVPTEETKIASLRVIDAKTKKGELYIRCISGEWYKADANTKFDIR